MELLAKAARAAERAGCGFAAACATTAARRLLKSKTTSFQPSERPMNTFFLLRFLLLPVATYFPCFALFECLLCMNSARGRNISEKIAASCALPPAFFVCSTASRIELSDGDERNGAAATALRDRSLLSVGRLLGDDVLHMVRRVIVEGLRRRCFPRRRAYQSPHPPLWYSAHPWDCPCRWLSCTPSWMTRA